MDLSLTKLPWYAQIGAFAGLAIAGVGAFFYFYEMPAKAALTVREEQLNGLRRNIAVGQATAKKLPQFRAQTETLPTGELVRFSIRAQFQQPSSAAPVEKGAPVAGKPAG